MWIISINVQEEAGTFINPICSCEDGSIGENKH